MTSPGIVFRLADEAPVLPEFGKPLCVGGAGDDDVLEAAELLDVDELADDERADVDVAADVAGVVVACDEEGAADVLDTGAAAEVELLGPRVTVRVTVTVLVRVTVFAGRVQVDREQRTGCLVDEWVAGLFVAASAALLAPRTAAAARSAQRRD